MNKKIAEILKDQISSLDWIDKIAGLVRPVTFKDKAGNVKTMPIYLNGVDMCKASAYEDLVPDSSKKSILYFEDGGMDVINAGCLYIDVLSSLKLVCWCNLKIINPEYSSAIPMKLEILRTIPTKIDNTDWVTKINVQFAGEDMANPFTPYTYDEQKQFLIYPYDYFSLNYKVRFSVPLNAECYDSVELNPDICP